MKKALLIIAALLAFALPAKAQTVLPTPRPRGHTMPAKYTLAIAAVLVLAGPTIAQDAAPAPSPLLTFSSPNVISVREPSKVLILHNSAGREARIDFDGPVVTYGGDMPVDEAARMFLETVGRQLRGDR